MTTSIADPRKDFEINVMGSLNLLEAYLIAAQRLFEGKVMQHETYSVSSGHALSLKELVHLYAEVSKQTVNVNWGGRPYRYR